MEIDLKEFFQASNPSRTIDFSKPEERVYYIDFAPVRGGKIIQALGRTISRLSPDQPTCQLFTGHIGCGKSTDLLRLKAELEEDGFHVVYFESTEDLDIADIDISDILLAIARRVSESLEETEIHLQNKGFRRFLQETWEFLNSPVELKGEANLPGLGKMTASTEGNMEFSLAAGIGKITTKIKDSPSQRSRLRQYLEPQTTSIIKIINEDLIQPAIAKLKQSGKKGLVVIVDNLDRVDAQVKASGRSQPEYLFIDRGDKLKSLHCHVVYTIPLSLIFSNESEALKNRLGGGVTPKVLPMVPVQYRDGREYSQGMNLLRQLVMGRAFPQLAPEERLQQVTKLFDSPETLDLLCRFSGGHVRHLLGLVYRCLQEQDPPWSIALVNHLIKQDRDRLTLPIDDEEWAMLRQVVKEQRVRGDLAYHTLLRNLFVFEYVDDKGNWFGLNPALEDPKGS